MRRTKALMRRAALGVVQAVLAGTAIAAAAVLAARLLQQGAPAEVVAGAAPGLPSQAAVRSPAGVLVLVGLLAGMFGAAVTAWLALAPLESWFRRGGLAMASAFGTFLGMLLLVPVEIAFGPPGLAAVFGLLLGGAVLLGLYFRRWTADAHEA